MSQGWSCMWATEPAPLKHWGRAGGWQTATVRAASAVPAHTASSVPLPETQYTLPGISAAAGQVIPPAGCAVPLSPYEHTLDFRISSSGLCLKLCVLPHFKPEHACAQFMEQTKIVFWVRPGESLAHKHTLELWAWEMYHSCLQWAEGTV